MSFKIEDTAGSKSIVMFNHLGLQMPNVWKISFLAKELGIKCDMKFLDFSKDEQKQAPHINLNPNGRIPTIIDNNNDFVVWESNAIMIYLAERYDNNNEHGFMGATVEERMQVLQWLFFQGSGQGPYYGQAHWFLYVHPEEIPSAVEHYQDEILRILGVLESHLREREWIVGSQCTLADFALLPYNLFYAARLLPHDITIEDNFPAVARWQQRLVCRRSVLETIKEREVEMLKFSDKMPIFPNERTRMSPVMPVIGKENYQ